MKNRFLGMLSLLLAMLMFMTSFGVVSVFADEDILHTIKAGEETKIEAEDYAVSKTGDKKGYYRDYGSGSKYPNNGCQYLGSDSSNFYYYVDVKQAGTYELNMYISGAGKKVFRVTVDDVIVGDAEMSTTETGVTENFAGNLNLSNGKHYIHLKSLLNEASNSFFYYLSLKSTTAGADFRKNSGSFKEIYIPGIIQAENFDLGADGSHSITTGKSNEYRADSTIELAKKPAGDFELVLSEGEYVNYTFISNVADMYTVSVSSKTAGEVLLYLDGVQVPTVNDLKIEEKYKETNLASMYVEEGEHTLRVAIKGNKTNLDYFRFFAGNAVGDKVKEEKTDAGTLNNVYKKLYVATTGNDETGDGSQANPFASIGRAKDEVAKINSDMTGDIVVYIQPGEYKLEETEVFGTEHGGKNGYNVIFKGTNILNPPLISGGQQVTGWKKGENGIWSAPLSDQEYVRNLYVNEFPAIRARSRYKYQMLKSYNDPNTEAVNDGYVFPKKNFPENFERIDEMELVFNKGWETRRVPVKNITSNETEYIITCFPDVIAGEATTTKAGESAYLENAMELLDDPGEFYYNSDEKRIYYYPYEQEDMTTAITYVGDTEKLIEIRGESNKNKIQNLIFDNLKIFYGAWNFASKYGWQGTQSDGIGTGSAIKGLFSGQFAAQIQVDNADRFVLRNCEIACHGSAAINLDDAVTNSKVEGNIIRDVSGTGIKIGFLDHHQTAKKFDQCVNIDVLNNVIRRIGGEFFNNVGISVYWEKNINVLHNVVEDVPYSGMSIGWGWEQEYQYDVGNYDISYNYVNDVMETNNDGGGIYTLGKLGGSRISHNFIRNHVRTAHGGLIYHDAGSGYVEDYNNVLINSAYALHVTPLKYNPKEIKFHDNYSNSENFQIYDDAVKQEARGIKLDKPTPVEEGNYTPEALEIIKNAGLEPQYKRLYAMAKMPEWHEDRHYGALMKRYESHFVEPGIILQAEDYMKGGEGVGFHKFKPANQVNTYREETEVALDGFTDIGSYAIGVDFAGEWLKYELNIEKEDDYYLTICGKQWWSPKDSINVAKVYIDDVPLDAEFLMPKINKWQELSTGPIRLKPGKYIIKMEFLYSYYFDKIKLLTEEDSKYKEVFGNETQYDDAIFRTYEEYYKFMEEKKNSDKKQK